MDYLQYLKLYLVLDGVVLYVLNLVINGLPSIPPHGKVFKELFCEEVLNLVINGLPSILQQFQIFSFLLQVVLNLVINGLPSILLPKVQMPYLWQKEVIFIWWQKLYIFPYFEDFRDFILIFYYIFFTFLLNSEHFIF